MKTLAIHRPYLRLAGVAYCLLAPVLHAQAPTAPAAPSEQTAEHLRSRLFIYDLPRRLLAPGVHGGLDLGSTQLVS
jgi:hypothetical protein